MLAAKGVDVNQACALGGTALAQAFERYNLGIMQMLLLHGADAGSIDLCDFVTSASKKDRGGFERDRDKLEAGPVSFRVDVY